MAIKKIKKVKGPEVDFTVAAKIIEDVEVGSHLEKSFLEYAYLIILQRALPDARDGLIPAKRRILYAMDTLNLQYDKKHVKSARVCGEVMGIFHPHSSSYGTLVGMAQDFNMRVPLVDGHGNFGSIEDGPAADRYTEARLSRASSFLLGEIKEDSVDMKPNYDSTTFEPTILPAQFPNMLINGSQGIAAGMANKMPPHNPREIMNATRWLLKHPEATLEKLMTFVPAPDFPTAGIILGVDGIKQAYKTGRGKFHIRARYHIEPLPRGKNRIIFTEMPYEVGVETVIEKIKIGIESGKIVGIADALDSTDKDNGMMFIVETKAGINPAVLVESLFKYTPLETSYGINNTVVTPDDTPAELGLKELLQIFIDFRIETVRRRTQHRLSKREHRMHQIEALTRVLLDIDKAIKIIRESSNPEEARTGLMKTFKLDTEQADYVMNMQLRRLTKFDRLELENEATKLLREIVELKGILDDHDTLINLIDEEFKEVAKFLDAERKSEVSGMTLEEHKAVVTKAAKVSTAEIADEPCYISLSRKGQVVRNPKAARNTVSALTTTRGKFIAVTNKARAFRLESIHVGEKPSDLTRLLPESLNAGERVLTVIPVTLEEGKVGGLAMGTKAGNVKIQAPNWPKTQDEFNVMALADENDEILSARWVDDIEAYDLVFITSDSSLLTFPASKVRPQGSLTGAGVAGIKFSPEDVEIIEFNVISNAEKENAVVVSVSDAGNAKFTPYALYPQKGRATGGVRSMKFLKTESKVTFSTVGVNPILETEDGYAIEALPLDRRRDGSGKPLARIPAR